MLYIGLSGPVILIAFGTCDSIMILSLVVHKLSLRSWKKLFAVLWLTLLDVLRSCLSVKNVGIYNPTLPNLYAHLEIQVYYFVKWRLGTGRPTENA